MGFASTVVVQLKAIAVAVADALFPVVVETRPTPVAVPARAPSREPRRRRCGAPY